MIIIFEILLKVKNSLVDMNIEKLEDMGVTSTYYDAPYEVTVDENGYGFYEKEDEIIDLHIYVHFDNIKDVEIYIDRIRRELEIEDDIKLIEVKENNWQQSFETIDLKNGWIIAEKNYAHTGYKKINFESQGSFGTGLHETTQDLLRYILDIPFEGLSVLDLGTGSGILSIAAALKNAERIIALDIRDVTSEVMHNASLNNINNIEVIISDVTSKNYGISEEFNMVFINIGGEETLASMEFINNVLKTTGLLFVSGLVEWSSDKVLNKIIEQGYILEKTTKTNEWVTSILRKV